MSSSMVPHFLDLGGFLYPEILVSFGSHVKGEDLVSYISWFRSSKEFIERHSHFLYHGQDFLNFFVCSHIKLNSSVVIFLGPRIFLKNLFSLFSVSKILLLLVASTTSGILV